MTSANAHSRSGGHRDWAASKEPVAGMSPVGVRGEQQVAPASEPHLLTSLQCIDSTLLSGHQTLLFLPKPAGNCMVSQQQRASCCSVSPTEPRGPGGPASRCTKHSGSTASFKILTLAGRPRNPRLSQSPKTASDSCFLLRVINMDLNMFLKIFKLITKRIQI